MYKHKFSAFAIGLLQQFSFPSVFSALKLPWPSVVAHFWFTGQALEMPVTESMEEELNEDDPFDVPEEQL